jgi:hypothetical protein
VLEPELNESKRWTMRSSRSGISFSNRLTNLPAQRQQVSVEPVEPPEQRLDILAMRQRDLPFPLVFVV